MENSKTITISDLLDQLTKKTSYDLIYVSYLRDIVHLLLDQKQLVETMSLGGQSKTAYEQAYDDILSLLFKFILNKLYSNEQQSICSTNYIDTDSIKKE